ncbi:FAD-dependent oxidoreductase [Salisediminibacterium halotolerans]|uniref:NADPH-dependent 2,4-dienoyl-CoA reductase, sulfur reductase n=1 Tax=Salisediminibacterium halotolerans TaxID=517425 RepID=A0A1H9QS76_9BACI|nr:FAD-dependent oxidoreductase [Salisediminibacterium haloalkalitolerans]SER63227.1 NADPH-dependent 2,4-dienoyl-CoA reductase, sulfur reductase [Salisediminibacterium haloalkalitolerans]
MKVVIIGGDAAGMSAAMQIVRSETKADVTVLEQGAVYSYAQCGLPYYLGGIVDDAHELIARPIDFFRDKHGIDARIYHQVQSVDTEHQTVSGTVLDSGETFTEPYDKLLVASGAAPIFPPFEGRDLAGIHVLKTIPDAETIAKDLEEDVLNVTVIGGGYIGLEVAENLVHDGRNVRLIDLAERVGNVYDAEISEKIAAEAEKQGVDLVLGEAVEAFRGENGRVTGVSTDKSDYNADMVIVAIGVKPNTAFLAGTGIHLHESGAIRVDPYMQTNIDHVYAAGDCATQYHRIKQKDDFVPLGTHANKQGRIAGVNIAGGSKTFHGIVGSSIMQFFDLTIGKTGLSENEAKNLGIDYRAIGFETAPIAHYMPDSRPIFLRMIKEKETDKLLGVQGAGETGVDKRVDVAATALYHGMTTHDMENLDISYAPPYNTAWDPIQQGARRL